MARFIEMNPVTGVEQWEDTYEGRTQIHTRQDVEPILELAKYERNNGLSDQKGKKTDLYLYARIPPVTILELKHKYGVNIFKRDHLKRAFEIINRDYAYLKCTEKRHTLHQ